MSNVTFVLVKSHILQDCNKTKKLSESRIDITHQCLLSILDSPLNQSGLVKIYISTVENVLIEIKGNTKIPRSLHRFEGLLKDLFKKKRIKTPNGYSLMKLVKNPITEYLPPNSIKFGLSQMGDKKELDFFKESASNKFVVFLNANQKGDDIFEDAEFLLKLSEYPLSSFVCCTKVCSLFEQVYGIF